MSEKVYTEAQMKAAIKSAFESGKDWATCYISWFTPSKADHNKHCGQAIRKAMKAAEQSAQADGAGVCPNCKSEWRFHDPRVCSVPAPQVA